MKLQQILRALRFDERGSALAAIEPTVKKMEAYLKRLVDEFEREYKKISVEQRVYETRMEKAIAQATAGGGQATTLPDNAPWAAITALEHVADFLKPVENWQTPGGSEKSDYCRCFLDSLDEASSRLRKALSAEFDNRAFSGGQDAANQGNE